MKKSLFLLFVGLMMLSPVRVFAIIAEGTSGTCKWVIDDEGALVVSPISGDKGTLSGGWWHDSPVEWLKYAESIKKVSFSGKISAKTCYGMFHGCNNVTEIDLSNLDTENVTDMIQMFSGCSSLSSLDLTNFTVNQTCDYGSYIFYNVGATIISNCKTPSSLPDDFFNSYYPAKPYCLVVPAGSENEYSNASGWRKILTRVMTDENPMVPQMYYYKYMLGYERKVSGNYATFCLPFDLDISNWRKETGYLNEVYEVSSVGGKMDKTTGLIKLQVSTKNNVLSAGTPFIVKLAEGQDKITFFSNYTRCDFRNGFPKARNVSVSIPDVEVSVSGTLFDKLTNLDKSKYRAFNTEGNFGPCDWVNTFRAYVYKNDTNSHAKADNIVLEFEDGTTTSIDKIDGMEIIDDNAPVYNLIGQRVNGQAKGLIIKNGKKVMVK